jgi:hypothetical protein
MRHKTVEERVAAVQRAHVEGWNEHRNREAANWRRARAELRTLPPMTRAGVLRWWQRGGVPGAPVYLLEAVHSAARGKSYWGKLVELRKLELIGQGRLPNPWKRCASNAALRRGEPVASNG